MDVIQAFLRLEMRLFHTFAKAGTVQYYAAHTTPQTTRHGLKNTTPTPPSNVIPVFRCYDNTGLYFNVSAWQKQMMIKNGVVSTIRSCNIQGLFHVIMTVCLWTYGNKTGHL
jgi:hypothetical protein